MSIYTASAIEVTAEVALSRGGLFLFALLCGGDYDQVTRSSLFDPFLISLQTGLRHCGQILAYELAKTQLGDTLLMATLNFDKKDLDAFICDWREELRNELLFNSSGHLSRLHPAAANAIGDVFPDLSIMLSYAKPLTSWTTGHLLPTGAMWIPRLPDIAQLGVLCERSFAWGTFDGVPRNFKSLLYEAVFLQRLYQVYSLPNMLLHNHL